MKTLSVLLATAAPVLLATAASVLLSPAAPVAAQVSYERILEAASEPGSWLTYSGSYGAQRYSTLDQIDRDNVGRLQPAWIYQARSTQKFEVSPLVVDGVMYITEPPSDATALDLRTESKVGHGTTFYFSVPISSI